MALNSMIRWATAKRVVASQRPKFRGRPARTYSSEFSGCSARERDLSKKFRMLRPGAQFALKFSGCSAWERHFPQNVQDAPHGSAIFFKMFRNVQDVSARERNFFSKCSRSSARERHFPQNVQAAPHSSAIFFKTWTNTTGLTGTLWYKITAGSIHLPVRFGTTKSTNHIPKLYRSPPLNTALLNPANHIERRTSGLGWYRIGTETLDIVVHE